MAYDIGPSSVSMERLFLALWPDVAMRNRLAALQASLPAGVGRHIAVEHLHLTLAFIGNVDDSQRRHIEDACGTVRARSLEITFDAINAKARSGIVWVRPKNTPPALLALVDQLHTALVGCWQRTDRRPFNAHVTLVRAWRGRLPSTRLAKPLVWIAREFCLVASIPQGPGVRYVPLRRWPLSDA